MKALNELYAEIQADENLRNEFLEANRSENIAEFLKAHNCEATLSEVEEFVKNSFGESGELSDDELDNVSAGKKCGTVYVSGRPLVASSNKCSEWRCRLCGCPKNGKHDTFQHRRDNESSIMLEPAENCSGCKFFWSTGLFGECENPQRYNN